MIKGAAVLPQRDRHVNRAGSAHGIKAHDLKSNTLR